MLRVGFGPGGGTFGAAASYDSAATALFARMSSQPGGARKGQINTLILALKTGATSGTNIWDKIDFLQVYAAADSQAALLNWKTAAADGTLVNTPTFATDRGFTTNGTNSYIDTGWNPTTFSGAVFVQDSAHMGFWTRTGAQSAGTDIGIRQATGTKQSLLVARNTSDVIVFRLNIDASGAVNGSSTDGTGHTVMTRSSSTAVAVFKNAVSNQTDIRASVSPANLNCYVGCVNLTGAASAFAAREYSVAHVGSNLANNEITDLYNALNAYLVAVGAA